MQVLRGPEEHYTRNWQCLNVGLKKEKNKKTKTKKKHEKNPILGKTRFCNFPYISVSSYSNFHNNKVVTI